VYHPAVCVVYHTVAYGVSYSGVWWVRQWCVVYNTVVYDTVVCGVSYSGVWWSDSGAWCIIPWCVVYDTVVCGVSYSGAERCLSHSMYRWSVVYEPHIVYDTPKHGA